MNSYGFTDTEWQETIAIFKKYPEVEKVVLFGSRAKNTFKPMSDVDIVLYGNKITYHTISAMQSDFEESQIPFFFDILDYKKITSDELKEHIRRYGKTIYEVDNDLPNGWAETTLGEVCDVQSGGTPSTKNQNYWNGNIGWITPRDLSSYTKVFIKKGERSITQLGLDNSSAKLLPKHTILFSSRAPIGYVVIAENEITTNQGFKNLICDEEISHYKFFYHLLKLKSNHIERLSSGSTFSEASASLMKSIEIKIPKDINEQKAIAEILTAFDDKIELLQAQNKTLETTAQTIFKEWFGKYQIGDKLPKGWRVGKLREVVNIFDSQRIPLSKAEREERKGKYRYYGATSVMDYVDDYIFDGIYLLFAEDGSVIDDNGHPFLQYVWGKFWVNNHTHILQGKNGFSTEMLYVLSKKMRVASIVNGAVQLKINQKNLLGFEIVIPADDILLKFDDVIQPLFSKLRINHNQIQSLKQTRDNLLPKLMSGQLRVEEFKESTV